MVIINTLLQIFCMYVLFREIFGYQLKKGNVERILILLMIAVLVFSRAFLHNINSFGFLIILNGIMMLIPVLAFKGEWKIILLFGINYRLVASLIYSAMRSIVTYFEKEPGILSSGSWTYLILAIALLVASSILRRNKLYLHRYVDDVNMGVLVIFTIGLLLVKWSGGVITTDTSFGIEILIGKAHLLSAILVIFLLAGVILSQVLLIQRRRLVQANELNQRCLEEQITQYQRLQKKDDAIRAFKHDYQAHMNMINSYLEQNDIQTAKEYIKQIEEIRAQLYTFSTGNLIVDAILNQYKEIGENEGITIEVVGLVPKTMKIKEIDLCAIFSNAMKNAFEATLKCSGKREIKLDFSNNRGFLFIKIVNPTAENIRISNGTLITTKSKKSHHGFGTKNMSRIAENNDGKVEWEHCNGNVVTRIRVRYE